MKWIRLSAIVGLATVAFPAADGAEQGARQRVALPSGATTADTFAPIALDLNLPAFRADVREGQRVSATFPMAIGMRRYKSPTGRFEVSSVEWNPWWIPPNSEWARKDTVTPPGPENPMGRVKIALGSLYFLHGTPFPQSVGRAASHGCFRMKNADAVDLATIVLRAGVPQLDSAAIAAMRQDDATRTVRVNLRIPVRIRYDVVEWRHDSLWVHPDVYRRGAATVTRALAVLDSAGLDTALVHKRVLRALVRRGSRNGLALARDSLLLVY